MTIWNDASHTPSDDRATPGSQEGSAPIHPSQPPYEPPPWGEPGGSATVRHPAVPGSPRAEPSPQDDPSPPPQGWSEQPAEPGRSAWSEPHPRSGPSEPPPQAGPGATGSGPVAAPLPGRRLRRSESNRVIAGVCAGVAEYTGIDANVVRLIAILFALMGHGVLLYIAAWLLLPTEAGPSVVEARRNRRR
jgi:phage shock protein PspC (stress-responsive transcriptional regulator)